MGNEITKHSNQGMLIEESKTRQALSRSEKVAIAGSDSDKLTIVKNNRTGTIRVTAENRFK